MKNLNVFVFIGSSCFMVTDASTRNRVLGKLLLLPVQMEALKFLDFQNLAFANMLPI